MHPGVVSQGVCTCMRTNVQASREPSSPTICHLVEKVAYPSASGLFVGLCNSLIPDWLALPSGGRRSDQNTRKLACRRVQFLEARGCIVCCGRMMRTPKKAIEFGSRPVEEGRGRSVLHHDFEQAGVDAHVSRHGIVRAVADLINHDRQCGRSGDRLRCRPLRQVDVFEVGSGWWSDSGSLRCLVSTGRCPLGESCLHPEGHAVARDAWRVGIAVVRRRSTALEHMRTCSAT